MTTHIGARPQTLRRGESGGSQVRHTCSLPSDVLRGGDIKGAAQGCKGGRVRPGMLRRLSVMRLGSGPCPLLPVNEQKVSPIWRKRVSWFLQSQLPLTLHLETGYSPSIPEIFLPSRTTNHLRVHTRVHPLHFPPQCTLDSEPHCSCLYAGIVGPCLGQRLRRRQP